MSKPPVRRPTPQGATEVLGRLTSLSQELAGAYRPATVVEILARALTDSLAPARLSIVLLDIDANQLVVPYDSESAAVSTDDPLLQLALRSGPVVFPRDVAAGAAKLGVTLVDPPPSWLGAPVAAMGRTIGAVSIAGKRAGVYGPPELEFVKAIAAQGAIALENGRLVELLSSGKREWELTVDAITQAICIVNAQGVVRRANRVFAELIRVPVTALRGRPWMGLLPTAWTEVVARALSEPGSTPAEVRSGDRVFLVSAVPIAGDEAGAAVLLFEDQTDKRRLQAQLIQSEKMSAIGQLIAGVAHDLNNPLASVVGFSDFLSEAGEVPANLAEPLQVIRQEAERAANIVKNLLNFARKQEAERRRHAVAPLLESTLALLGNQLMALKVEATLDVEPGVPEVDMNPNQITQVFVNLVNNAAQAIGGTGKSGRIWVTARKWLDGVAVSVSDDGPGIPDEIAARVFEPFFTTKAEGEGTGLGLSICQGIVKEHGGRITLDSSPGAGATFTVELPGASRHSKPEEVPASAETTTALRILIVDDEPHILHYMRATLESWGHDVEVAEDGSQALKRALTKPFDVIICDLRMPRLGGREMFQNLTLMHPGVAARIIFATGDTVRGDTLQFLESLGRPYLHKPFTLAELRSVLGRVTRAS
jgi:two-component system NtrC family sensor kinase